MLHLTCVRRSAPYGPNALSFGIPKQIVNVERLANGNRRQALLGITPELGQDLEILVDKAVRAFGAEASRVIAHDDPQVATVLQYFDVQIEVGCIVGRETLRLGVSPIQKEVGPR